LDRQVNRLPVCPIILKNWVFYSKFEIN
jgi:hypothetical protein